MRQCEICLSEEGSDGTEVRLVTVRERVCCESCILLGMDALSHWHGELEKDGSDEISIGGQVFCESHVIMGIDGLKADMEAFLKKIAENR